MTKKDEEKKDDEAPRQEGEASFITIYFQAPGSAHITGLQTQGVNLNQVAMAARELQGVADFEMWWVPYISRMEQVLAQLVEQSLQKVAQKAEEDLIRRTLMQGGMKPS